MKEIILKYYLPVFGMTLIPIVPPLVINYNTPELGEMILWLSIMSIVLTLVLGTFQYKFGDRINTKRKKKQIKKDLFQRFISNGFSNNEVSVSGYFKDYFLVISPEKDEFQPNKWLEIEIIFNPKQQGQFIPVYVFQKLHKLKRKEYTWNSNSLVIKKVYGFKLPKYDKIIAILDKAITDLKNNNIESIDYQNWNHSIGESLNHYKQISTFKN
ncbi:hypothetical protein [Polaribacter porphyrae]|uniref:Uncharacterized protein n=1 Tax=Polaribacter porphyrae TaxID=1137780 RepID=A0A2S7WK17_9FLAO|nr:hypothetical protein [Polaribacter porphyrae]PQJ77955.1 hypothetical protein BTO18_01585 [Polaribacter porphyrae]